MHLERPVEFSDITGESLVWKATKKNLSSVEASILSLCTKMRAINKEELQKLDVDYVASFQRDAKKEIVISRPYSDDEEGSVELVPSTPTADGSGQETTTKDEKKTAASRTPSDGSGSEGAVTVNKHAVVANLKKTGNEPKRKKPRVSAASSESPSSSSESHRRIQSSRRQRCTDPKELAGR